MEAMLRIATKYAEDHPVESARRLESLSPDEVAAFLDVVDPMAAIGVLDRMAPSVAGSCIEVMEAGPAAKILSLSTVQQSVRLLRHVDPHRRGKILGLLPGELAAQTGRILRFPAGSAASIADNSVEALPSEMTVGDARRVARDARVPYLYVVDRDHVLVGVVHKRDVQQSGEHVTLDALVIPKVIRVPAHAAVAELLRHHAWRDFDALPVVDREGVYLGVIRHKTLRELGEPRTSISRMGMPLDTFVDLAELYWLGLSTMVAALAAGTTASEEEGRDGR
jgi:magnesium transporter